MGWLDMQYPQDESISNDQEYLIKSKVLVGSTTSEHASLEEDQSEIYICKPNI